jgi:hypothetical protein
VTRFSYAVTFEFQTLPQLTHRGTVVASKVAYGASLAIKAAQKALHPQNWDSMVFVVLERRPVVTKTEAVDETPKAADDAVS